MNLWEVGRVTPCAPLDWNVGRRARNDAPYPRIAVQGTQWASFRFGDGMGCAVIGNCFLLSSRQVLQKTIAAWFSGRCFWIHKVGVFSGEIFLWRISAIGLS